MSILHYFGNDPDKRARFIFNLIAPIYGFVDSGLADDFGKSAELLNQDIPLQGKRILDVGCGTGAWGASLLNFKPKEVFAVDFSKKMLNEARKKHPEINFQQASAEDLNIFQDNEFDIVTASYVLHGVTKEVRKRMLTEMKRVAKEYVVVHDFYGRTDYFVRFLEFMERSDYKNFKKHFMNELKEHFAEARMIDTKRGTGLYIGKK